MPHRAPRNPPYNPSVAPTPPKLDYATPPTGRRRPRFPIVACAIAAVFWTLIFLLAALLLVIVVIQNHGSAAQFVVGVTCVLALAALLACFAFVYWRAVIRLLRHQPDPPPDPATSRP
jgi:hypothetical protein